MNRRRKFGHYSTEVPVRGVLEVHPGSQEEAARSDPLEGVPTEDILERDNDFATAEIVHRLKMSRTYFYKRPIKGFNVEKIWKLNLHVQFYCFKWRDTSELNLELKNTYIVVRKKIEKR